jgi:hypothetical protein
MPYMRQLCTQLVVLYVLRKLRYKNKFKPMLISAWKIMRDDS